MKHNYLNKAFLSRAGVALTGFALLYGCIKPDDLDFSRIAEANWSPDMAVPLVNSSLTAADIITKGDKDGRIEIDADKFCTLIYEGDLFAKKAEDIVVIPNQGIPQENINMTPAAALAFASAGPGTTIPFSGNAVLDFSTGASGVLLDSIIFKSGTCVFDVTTDIQHETEVTITLPAATKAGVPFSQSVTLTTANSFQASMNLDMTGYTFDMTNGGSQTNKIPANISVVITKGTGPNPTVGNRISFTPSITSVTWKRLHGDMGTKTISTGIPDTVLFSAFRNSMFTGHIVHADPRVIIEVRNSYGVPLQVNFLGISGNIPAPDPGANNFPINNGPGGGLDPLTVAAPSNSQIGTTVTSTRALTKDNTASMSVKDVINLNPEFLIYNLQYTINPGGTPPSRNFALDTSYVNAHIRCEMPLYGQAQNFELNKEFDFEFKDTSAVEYAAIRTFIVNGFPLDVNMNVYFLDASGNKVDSLETRAISDPNRKPPIRAGEVNSAGKVIKSTTATTDYTITKLRWKRISALAKKIRVSADLESQPGATDIKIYSDYKMDVRIGVRAKLKVQTDF